jgi:glycosyltransferase involved in cell wall biosynthesis
MDITGTHRIAESKAELNPVDSPDITTRIAIVVTHPIQYFAPWHRALAAIPGVTLKVFFCSKKGAETYYDRDFGTEVKWDIPLLDGYEWEFLASRKPIRNLTFWATDNPNIGEALASFRPSVVIIHGYVHRTMWRAVSWSNRNRVPVMLISDSNATATRTLWKRAAKAIVVRHLYRRLDGAFSCGDNNRKYHLQYGIPKERIFQGALPIDCERLIASVREPSVTRREIRQRFGIPEDAFVIVYAGKLIPLKCLLHLVEAIYRCAQRGLNVWGLLVGEGSERPALETFIAERNVKNVVLAGFVNQSSIGKYYAASEALALTSVCEAKGLPVPEAGCFGCPAILSDRVGCIGPNDSARLGENALSYPWSNIDALTDRIAKLYEDQALYRAMSNAAMKIANLQNVDVVAPQLKEAAVQLQRMGTRQ